MIISNFSKLTLILFVLTFLMFTHSLAQTEEATTQIQDLQAQDTQTTDFENILDAYLEPIVVFELHPEDSIAKSWNEVLLTAIRNDFARPTVHARNLFHSSMLMYDLWALQDATAQPYLYGNTLGDYSCSTIDTSAIDLNDDALHESISYAMYGLLKHRFAHVYTVHSGLDLFMEELGYEAGLDKTSSEALTAVSSPAELGTYLADCVIAFGLQDGSNESVGYANEFYWAINGGLNANEAGSRRFDFPNRWQPLIFEGGYIDQSGNFFEGNRPIEFLGAEWGQVHPFALPIESVKKLERGQGTYWMYHDPGQPPQITDDIETNHAYLWNFATVAKFSAELDPKNSPMIDISPNALGNIDFENLPTSQEDYESFYTLDGGMMGSGYELNPVTGEAYKEQLVPLGDYARVLAEFWADGPDSETPPGHWFTILNYVSDHEAFVPKWKAEGELLEQLEWDIKAYFTLGAAMHDAAVASWGIKGWYDYPRPISVIRYMSKKGQSSDPSLDNFHPHGFPLIEGFSELVQQGDALAGEESEHIGKVKIRAWKGPDYISNPETDTAGTDWILAERWWPYQRPTFITPPFAGYISGHSTFSRAAAEVLTAITGSPYFPEGLGEFKAAKNEFLVFEEGPNVDIVLQWASYGDAADQTSLSRIWGGIHPPIDDIPGRRIGITIAEDAVEKAQDYFDGN